MNSPIFLESYFSSDKEYSEYRKALIVEEGLLNNGEAPCQRNEDGFILYYYTNEFCASNLSIFLNQETGLYWKLL